MRIGLITFLFSLSFIPSIAQSTISVEDEEGNALAYAHILYAALGEDQGDMVLTNQFGSAQIPLEFTQNNARFTISISYIGYKKVDKDTVQADENIKVILEGDNVTLNQLVVTAQYSPNSPEKSVHKISIINSEKIEAMAAVNLTDVLNNELNMRIGQDNILGSQLSIQGLGGENVKILIDGVPMIGRTDGNIDLNQINLDNIERIEVIEGPMSVNYGTNALAGAINLITKKGGSKRWQGGIHGYTESIGKYNLNANLNYNNGPHQIILSGGRNYFDGWNPGDSHWDRSDPIADTSRVQQWNPKEQYMLNFQYALRVKSWQLRYKGDYFEEKITNKGMPRPPYYISAFDDYYYTTRFDNALFANGPIGENFSGNFIAAYNTFERNKNTYVTDLTTLEQSLSENPEDQDTSQFNLVNLRGSIAQVKQFVQVNYELGYDINLEEGIGKRIEDGKQRQDDYAIYGSAEYRPWENTIIRPGLRWAYNTNYDSPLIPSLNVKQDYKKYTFRASYALGFRAPSLKEQYFEFVDSNHNIVGNQDLKAENSNNLNLSAQYTNLLSNSLYKFEVSGFYNTVENLITLAQVSDVEYTYVNILSYQTAGFNMNYQMNIYHLKFTLGGSYIGRNNQIEEDQETDFNWAPEIRTNVAYEFRKIGLTAALFLKYQGRLPNYAIDENNEVYEQFIDAYTWADFTLSKKFWNKQINLSAGIKNLFDVTSVNSGGSADGGVHGGSGGPVSIGTGRSYFVSLKYNFKSKN